MGIQRPQKHLKVLVDMVTNSPMNGIKAEVVVEDKVAGGMEEKADILKALEILKERVNKLEKEKLQETIKGYQKLSSRHCQLCCRILMNRIPLNYYRDGKMAVTVTGVKELCHSCFYRFKCCARCGRWCTTLGSQSPVNEVNSRFKGGSVCEGCVKYCYFCDKEKSDQSTLCDCEKAFEGN